MPRDRLKSEKRRRQSPNLKIVILYYMVTTRVPALYLYNIYYIEHFSNRGSRLISGINIIYNMLGIIMIVFITASALGCYDRAHSWSCKRAADEASTDIFFDNINHALVI